MKTAIITYIAIFLGWLISFSAKLESFTSFVCWGKINIVFGVDNTMHTCCSEPNKNITLTDEEFFLPPERGNFTITYDVTVAYPGSYLAHVSESMSQAENLVFGFGQKGRDFLC